jgi:ubiquitin-like-conjugating enzyme ATG3
MSSLLGSLRSAREWAMPTLKQSAFLEKGVLTPEEFVLAGDELVYKCPTWAWEAGQESKRKTYLPPDKQYLVTRNVPCQNRCSSMESDMIMEGGEGGDDDWMVSSIIQRSEKLSLEDEFDMLDEEGEVIEKPKLAKPEKPAAAEEEDEYADMDAFEDDNILQDDAAVAADVNHSGGDVDHTVKVRTYDLSITYDKYYQTPRVWMIGRNTQDQPLTGAEMMEDVISDYANKTVTMESHPHVAGPHASIHPCQHGKVMKAIVRNLIKSSTSSTGAQQETGPSVEMYIFIFLKFVSSMIPTINYDFTMDVTADTSK